MSDKYFTLYVFVESKIAKFARAAILFAIAIMLFAGLQNDSVKISLIILSAFLINELFIASLTKRKPEFEAKDGKGNNYDKIIFSARAAFSKSKSSYEIIEKISKQKEVKFFLEKIGIAKLEKIEISREELLSQSIDIVKWVRGKYVTEVDIAASYVLLSEEETRFLQKANLNNDDCINVCYWARRKFSPDNLEQEQIKLLGPGVFDSLVESWNYELKKYSKDLTREVLARFSIPNIVGREKEYEQLLVALSRKKSSNVVLIGEPGVGKMSLVEFLAYESFIGYAPKDLRKRRVFELFVDRL